MLDLLRSLGATDEDIRQGVIRQLENERDRLTPRPPIQACASCGESYPPSEFEHPFYCDASQGTESETVTECRECLREALVGGER